MHNSFVFFWQIVTKSINATFLLINEIKMIGMLLNVVHFQVHKNILTKDMWHEPRTANITLVIENKRSRS